MQKNNNDFNTKCNVYILILYIYYIGFLFDKTKTKTNHAYIFLRKLIINTYLLGM